MAKKQRKSFTTTLDHNLIVKADLLKSFLRGKGVEKDGINELLEEGIELVIKEYSQKYEESLEFLN